MTMSLFGNNKKSIGQANTLHLKPGMCGLKAGLYKLLNTPYVDILIVRGNKKICRIVTKDTGFDMFSVDGLGTFLMPQGNEMQKMLYDGRGIFLFYRHDSQTPGELVDKKEWSTFEFPPYSPAVFQKKLEAKTVSDLLSEEQKDMSWILWLAVLAIVAVAVIMILGGV